MTIAHEWLSDETILVISPQGPLESGDFDELAKQVDERIQEKGELAGLLIHAESFPGWEDFDALVSHMRFVRHHHQKIKKVVVATDGAFVALLPRVADHFVHAEIKHFGYDEKQAALDWLGGNMTNS